MTHLTNDSPLKDKIKKEIRAAEEMYLYTNGETIASVFRKALVADQEIDKEDVEMLISAIPEWIERPILIDIFASDRERSDFEKFMLKNYPKAKKYYDTNKLRASLLRFADSLLQMAPSIFVNEELRQRWQQEIAIVEQDKEHVEDGEKLIKSTYEISYDTEARVHYMAKMTVLLNEICICYIQSKLTPQ